MNGHTIVQGVFIHNRPCIKVAVVGSSFRPLICEVDTSGAYELLLPWIVAINVGFRPDRPRNRFSMINGYRLNTRRGAMQVMWNGSPKNVRARVYGSSNTSSPMWLKATQQPLRPFPGIDGYVGGAFFQHDERLAIEYRQGQPAVYVEVP